MSKKEVEEPEIKTQLCQELRLISSKKQLSPSQRSALVAIMLRLNPLLTGPKGMGKRWISKHAAQFLTVLGEKVELMVKFFGVSADGKIWIDAASVCKALEQIRTATVLMVHDVPVSHSGLFLAHLDFVCRMHRSYGGSGSEKLPFEGCEQLPFGGLQVIATQDILDLVEENDLLESKAFPKRVHPDIDPIVFQ